MQGAVIKAVAAIVLTPIIAFLFTLVLPKEYSSSVGILVDTSPPVMEPTRPETKLDDLINFGRGRTVQTNVDILLGSKVIGQALLMTQEEGRQTRAFELTNARLEQLIDLLPRRIRVDSSRESDVVTLRVTLDDPELAASIANNIGRAYIRVTQEVANKFGEEALTAVQARIERTRNRLNELDDEVATLKQELGVTDLPSELQIATRTIADLALRENALQSELNGTTAELVVAENHLARLQRYIEVGVRDQYNPTLQSIEVALSTARANLAQLRERYTDERPEVKQVLGQVRELEAQKAREEQKIEASIDRQINPNYQAQEAKVIGLRERKQNIERQLAQVQADKAARDRELVVFPEAERRLNDLIRQKANYERIFMEMEARRDGLITTPTETVGRRTNAYIVSDARPSTIPSSPNVTLYTLAGLGLGIAIAAIIVLPKAPGEGPTYPGPGAFGPATPADRRRLGEGDDTGPSLPGGSV